MVFVPSVGKLTSIPYDLTIDDAESMVYTIMLSKEDLVKLGL